VASQTIEYELSIGLWWMVLIDHHSIHFDLMGRETGMVVVHVSCGCCWIGRIEHGALFEKRTEQQFNK
jgi:hypothetical protein